MLTILDFSNSSMKKYMISATFEWHDGLMELIPEHRALINKLIEKGVMESYAVSMEAGTAWIVMLAKSKAHARKMLEASPLTGHMELDIAELMFWDGRAVRLPALVMN